MSGGRRIGVALLTILRAEGTREIGTETIGGLIYIGSILGALAAAAVAEWLGRKRILATAVAIFGLGELLGAVSASGEMLGAARFLSGVGIGGALTTAMTIARNNAARLALPPDPLVTAGCVALMGIGVPPGGADHAVDPVAA